MLKRHEIQVLRRAEHTWTQVRGALPKWDGQSVYITGFTPFRMTLNIA